MSSLRDRCRIMWVQLANSARERPGTQADDLLAFVLTEQGRTADQRLDDSAPLCLYFKNKKDREEFITAFLKVKPDAITRKMP